MYHNERDEKQSEREIEKKTWFLELPVLLVAFLHDLVSGLEFATGRQTPPHKT
jgi:hypothetical protein